MLAIGATLNFICLVMSTSLPKAKITTRREIGEEWSNTPMVKYTTINLSLVAAFGGKAVKKPFPANFSFMIDVSTDYS